MALFIPISPGCLCGQPVDVQASCDGDPACVADFAANLQCTQVPPPPCQTEPSLSIAVEGCIEVGKVVTATFTVTMMPPFAGCTYRWRFGDGSPVVVTTVPTVSHVYTVAGTFQATVDIDCPLAQGGSCATTVRAPVDVPSCCPKVIGLTAMRNPPCAGPGISKVTFSGTLTPALTGCSFLWSFDDGTPNITTPTPFVVHDYVAPGIYSAAVTAICPGVTVCFITTITVHLPRCCPVATDISWNLDGNKKCANGQGVSATVIFSAVTDPMQAAGTYKWDFGDVSPPVTNPGPNATHAYAAPGSYNVKVDYVPDSTKFPNCPPSSFPKAIVVPACTPGDIVDPSDGGEGGGCFALRAIMVIAAILAGVSLLLAACVPAAASALLYVALACAILAFGAGLVWALFCPRPCAWGLLFAWQVALGIGYAALYFSTCCAWLVGVGLPSLALGLTLAVVWKSRCKKTQCELLKELVVVLSGVVLPVLGWLGVIPGLSACTNTALVGALSTLIAALVIAAANCIPSASAAPPAQAKR
jgi:PKD repeat protein